jgi:hypothetical protein
MAKVYEEQFLKKDGSVRKMRFYKISELSLAERAAASIPAPTEGKRPQLADGSELVWDIDAQGFRVFNWNTVLKGF